MFFINRYLERIEFSNYMKSLGFESSSITKQTQTETLKMCEDAVEIKIINVSGFHYLNANENLLKRALLNGVRIKFLCANPSSIFLKDIENMEYNKIQINGKRMREADSHISDKIYDLIAKYKDFGLEMRFYSTEYRLPYILATYKDGSIKSWLIITLPPYKSTEVFVLRGVAKPTQSASFIDMMQTNFDTIWEHSSKSLKEIMKINE